MSTTDLMLMLFFGVVSFISGLLVNKPVRRKIKTSPPLVIKNQRVEVKSGVASLAFSMNEDGKWSHPSKGKWLVPPKVMVLTEYTNGSAVSEEYGIGKHSNGRADIVLKNSWNTKVER